MKFMVLKSKLRLPKYAIVGLLEGLWALTARSASDGAIGKYSNEEIAAWLEWEGEPDTLIDALVASKFLDACAENRLVVHDWADHAPTYIKGNMAKGGREFAEPKELPKEAPKDIPKEPPKEAPKDGSTKSSLVKSSQNLEEANASLSGKPDPSPPVCTINGKRADAVAVLDFLNAKTGRHYQPVDANLRLIAARLKEGASVQDCRSVIAKKAREWGNDAKMEPYLRPATLFNATKFAQYRGELIEQPEETADDRMS